MPKLGNSRISPLWRRKLKNSTYLQAIKAKIAAGTATTSERHYFEKGEWVWTVKDSKIIDKIDWDQRLGDGSAHLCLMCEKPIGKRRNLCVKCNKINKEITKGEEIC